MHKVYISGKKEPFRYFLGYNIFPHLRGLIIYLEKNHQEFWAISDPFPYPECQRFGLKRQIFTDAMLFRQHLSIFHRSKHLPSPSVKTGSATHKCLLCQEKAFPSQGSLSKHTTVVHTKRENTFTEPFPCPEYRRLAQTDYIIHDLADWCSHVAEWHGSPNAPYPTCLAETRCLLCNKFVLNIRVHASTHKRRGQFDAPFPCPECTREGREAMLIEDGEKWTLHCAAAHGLVPTTVRTDVVNMRGSSRRCLLCDGIFSSSGLRSHVTRSHERNGGFEKPFPCPECVKTGHSESPPYIEGRQAWEAHCVSVHSSAESLRALAKDWGADKGPLAGSSDRRPIETTPEAAEGLFFREPTSKKRTLRDDLGDDLMVIPPTKKQRVEQRLAKGEGVGEMEDQPSTPD